MTFKEIYKHAMDMLNRLSADNRISNSDTTLCVICSRSGKLYHGLSRNSEDPAQSIPAERVALGSMVMAGETAIDTLVLINAMSRIAILPSKDSVDYFFTVNPENVNGKAVTPNKEVPFIEIGDPSLIAPAPAAKSAEPAAPKKNLLLDRVNSLMEGVDEGDDDDEEFLEELDTKKKKKKRFGFF